MDNEVLKAAVDLLLASTAKPTEEQRATFNEYLAWQAFCNNPDYTVIVRNYLLGQYRIQLCDCRLPDPYAPPMHGSIVQEMCTYDRRRAEGVTDLLCLAPQPLQMARSFATPTNCDRDGGRIRLDDDPNDHPTGYRRR